MGINKCFQHAVPQIIGYQVCFYNFFAFVVHYECAVIKYNREIGSQPCSEFSCCNIGTGCGKRKQKTVFNKCVDG